MTGFITMFDTIDEGAWPADPQAVLGYVDGHIGDQPDWAYVQARFPRAYHLSIALDPAHDAEALDIENGAAQPPDEAAWHARQRARGVARPCFYASGSLMEARVVPVMRAAGIARQSVRLWSAHYTGTAHVCGPASCGLTSIPMDGTQWTDRAFGRDLDQSLLLGDFFGGSPVPVPPPQPQPQPQPSTWEAIVANVPVIRNGSTGQAVRNWQGLLIARGHMLAADGNFGVQTEAATLATQRALGVAADGVVGKLTWAAALGG